MATRRPCAVIRLHQRGAHARHIIREQGAEDVRVDWLGDASVESSGDV